MNLAVSAAKMLIDGYDAADDYDVGDVDGDDDDDADDDADFEFIYSYMTMMLEPDDTIGQGLNIPPLEEPAWCRQNSFLMEKHGMGKKPKNEWKYRNIISLAKI